MVVLAVLLLVVVGLAVLFVAVTGSTATVDLVWDAAGIAWAPTALAVFLLGAAVMLLAETAVNLLLRGSRTTRRDDGSARRTTSRHTSGRRTEVALEPGARAEGVTPDGDGRRGPSRVGAPHGDPAEGFADGPTPPDPTGGARPPHGPQLLAPPPASHRGNDDRDPPATRSGRRAAH